MNKKDRKHASGEPRNMAALAAWARGDAKNFAIAQIPGGIEAQEVAGQTAFVESQTLPREGTIAGRGYGSEEVYRPKLEAIGFVFGREVDSLFVECQLPPGWKKVADQHSMWSHLEDAQGRERAAIFYKAAFYDRSAHLDLATRYRARRWYAASPAEPELLKETPEQVCAVVVDGDTPIWHSGSFAYQDWEGRSRADKAARTWLDEH